MTETNRLFKGEYVDPLLVECDGASGCSYCWAPTLRLRAVVASMDRRGATWAEVKANHTGLTEVKYGRSRWGNNPMPSLHETDYLLAALRTYGQRRVRDWEPSTARPSRRARAADTIIEANFDLRFAAFLGEHRDLETIEAMTLLAAMTPLVPNQKQAEVIDYGHVRLPVDPHLLSRGEHLVQPSDPRVRIRLFWGHSPRIEVRRREVFEVSPVDRQTGAGRAPVKAVRYRNKFHQRFVYRHISKHMADPQ